MRNMLFRLFVILGVMGLVSVGGWLVARQTWTVQSAQSLTTSEVTRAAYQDIGDRVVTLARKKCSPFIVDLPTAQTGDPMDEIEILYRKLYTVELGRLIRSLGRQPTQQEIKDALNTTPYYQLERINWYLLSLNEHEGNGPVGTADIGLVVWASLGIGNLIDFGEVDSGDEV